MAHSGKEPNPEMAAAFKQFIGDKNKSDFMEESLKELQEKAAEENKFPHGKLNNADEGVFAMAVGEDNGAVVLQFAEPQRWIGLTPQQAVELGQMLIKRARKITKEPLTIGLH